MPTPPLSLADLADLAATGRIDVGPGLELVAGVLLAAPTPSAAVLRTVADLAAALDTVARDHRVLVREAFALGPHDLVRPEVALVRPLGAGAAIPDPPAWSRPLGRPRAAPRPAAVTDPAAHAPTAPAIGGGHEVEAIGAPQSSAVGVSDRAIGAAVALAVFVGDDEAPLRWRAQRCARAGVREAWTLAVGERRASRWRGLVDGRYARRDPILAGEAVAPDGVPAGAVVPWR